MSFSGFLWFQQNRLGMAESLRGKYLVAGKGLRDPNFYRSVILVVEHNDEGAMGLVINRPSSITVAHALTGHFNLPETDDLVYAGGPVEPSALFILHNLSYLETDEAPIVPNVFVGSSPEAFEQAIHSAALGDSDVRFRILSGCAGWGANQLDDELARGDWYVQSACDKSLFDDNPYELWEHLVKRLHEHIPIFPPMKGNPEWN